MTLSAVIASMASVGDVSRADVPDTWLQGRSLFGGIQSALALRAMRSRVPAEVPLRVLQTTFVGPVPAGQLRLDTRVLREGKNVIHAEARIMEGDQTACLVVGIFGKGRPSRATLVPAQRPLRPTTGPIELPFMEGITPTFTQHFRIRWLEGALPFSGAKKAGAILDVGLRESGALSEEAVLAIADAPPPMALSMLDAPAAGSSLTWTIELLTAGKELDAFPLDGYRLDCELDAGGAGYTSQSVMVWGPRGEPVALSRQNMVVFG